jgi:uncharacterized Zn finger protein
VGLTLEDAFDERALRSLAGDLWFSRGRAYWQDGRVEPGERTEGRVTAVVRGTRPYEVELNVLRGDAGWACSCPLGDDGLFCKHSVAVALAMIGPSPEASTATRDRSHDLAGVVGELDRAELERLVLAVADRDQRLWSQLEGRALAKEGAPMAAATWEKRVARAFEPGREGFVDYRAAPDWADGVRDLLGELNDLVASGHASEVIGLAERAHERTEAAIQYVDDSDGHLSWISAEIGDLHLRACTVARPEPLALAARLLELEIGTDLPGFGAAAERYAGVLGVDGLAEYRRLLEPRYEAAAGTDDRWSSERFGTKEAMASLARAEGDVDALMVLRSDEPWHTPAWIDTMQALVDAGRLDDAIDWGFRGLDGLVDRPGQADPLVRALAELLASSGRADQADDVLWSAFERRPNLGTYRQLVGGVSSDAVGWRRRALTTLRSRIDERPDPGSNPLLTSALAAVLVEILLYDGEADDAWAVATEHGAPQHLWLSLADAREADHPLDAIPIHLDDVAASIDKKNRSGYRQAVKRLEHVRRLARSAGDEGLFAGAVSEIRTTHKAKRTLMAMLDDRGW